MQSVFLARPWAAIHTQPTRTQRLPTIPSPRNTRQSGTPTNTCSSMRWPITALTPHYRTQRLYNHRGGRCRDPHEHTTIQRRLQPSVHPGWRGRTWEKSHSVRVRTLSVEKAALLSRGRSSGPAPGQARPAPGGEKGRRGPRRPASVSPPPAGEHGGRLPEHEGRDQRLCRRARGRRPQPRDLAVTST